MGKNTRGKSTRGKNTQPMKLARHLLAATCLIAGVGAVAHGQTVTENPPGAFVGSTYGTEYGPPGATTEFGWVGTTATDELNANDDIEFSVQTPGVEFSFTELCDTGSCSVFALDVNTDANPIAHF